MNARSNRKESRIVAMLASAVVWALVIGAITVPVHAQDRVDIVSNKNFTATVNALTTALKSEAMMIVAEIDHQNMLKMVGASIKGAKTIEFGKPDMGKMLLPMKPDVGLEMPGRFYVWERGDGKTVISYRKVSQLYASYGSPQIADAGNMMDMMAEKLAQAAAR